MSRRWRVAIGTLAVVVVLLVSGALAVSADDSDEVGSKPPVSSILAPNAELSEEIYGSGRASVGDGHGGIAGWIDPTQLGGGRDPKVYNNDSDQVGYWVDNLGFVDTATHDSPSYDPNALRVARFGSDAVQAMEGLKADLDACLETHTAPVCAEAAGE
jgi:hypothetical protein